jgi:uncharacterized protein YcaQ
VLPKAVYDAPAPSVPESHRILLRTAARALGIGTEQDLRDYFRLAVVPTRRAIAELVESGELLPAGVEGWRRPAYLWHRATVPRRIEACALLSPFDSLIFERTRTEDLFDYRFRIEIYVPAAKRVYGYYVYSFLLGEHIVARVDLKADRQTGTLQVRSSWHEAGVPVEVADRLCGALHSMATWLGLREVSVSLHGDLAPALLAACERA